MKSRSMVARAVAGTLIATAVAGPAFAADESGAWGYAGATGPEHWGDLSSRYELCKTGLMQSPIDLKQANAVGDLEVSTDWDPGPLVIVNNGKTVQANFAPGSYMTSGGSVFNLVQVHFHTPSEHTFSGEHYPLVAHFVHATDEGSLGVLGVLFEAGEANGELQKIIDAAAAAGAEPETVSGVTLDPNGLLPEEIEVYRYMGSLTTPPCSEGVNWHVVEDVVEASPEQIRAMETMMGMNARPVLPLNGRLLVEPD
ncbi:MAG: carbonic anhydrase family protein [Pseudomonadales bacterium]